MHGGRGPDTPTAPPGSAWMAPQGEGAPTAAGEGSSPGRLPGWKLWVFSPYVIGFITVFLSLGVYFATGKTCATPCLEFLVPHWCEEGVVCVCHGTNFCYASYVGIYWPERGVFLVGLTLTGVLWFCGLLVLHPTYADLFALESHDGNSGGAGGISTRPYMLRWLDDRGKKRRYMLRWLNGAGIVGAVGLVGQGVLSLRVSFNGHAAFAVAFFLVAFFWHGTLTWLQWRMARSKPLEPGGLAELSVMIRGTYMKRVKNTAFAVAALVMNLAILVLAVSIDNDSYLTIAVPLHEWTMIIFIFIGFTGHGMDIWHCVKYDRINKVHAFDEVLPSPPCIAKDGVSAATDRNLEQMENEGQVKVHQYGKNADSDTNGSIVPPVSNHDYSAPCRISGSGSSDDLAGGGADVSGGTSAGARNLGEGAFGMPGAALADEKQV